MTSRWTDEHARLLVAAEPRVPEATPREIDRAWARVRDDLPTANARRRRRRHLWVSAGMAVATLTVGGVATAQVLTAHTGRYPSDAEDLRLGGPGEKLDPGAPDFAAVLAQLDEDIPFPSRDSRAIARRLQVEDGRRDGPGVALVSTGALRYWLARASVCAWANSWAAATAGNGTVSADHARQMLAAAPAWRSVTDVDRRQTVRYRWMTVTDATTGKSTRERYADTTPAFYFPRLRTAAENDDLAGAGRTLRRHGACDPALDPDFPSAVPPGMS